MAKNYVKVAEKATRNISVPQSQMARQDQVLNSAGGYVFEISNLNKLRRFLILGSASGSYYASSKKLTKDHAKNIVELFSKYKSGKAAIDEIVKISDEGRAPKNDPAIFALALAASCENGEVREYALTKVNQVCRIATHLFTFITYCDSLRGWGRGLRTALSKWYSEKTVEELVIQVCKYPQRKVEGEPSWSHRDVLRKIHLKADSVEKNFVYKYAVKGMESFDKKELTKISKKSSLDYLLIHEKAKKATSEQEILNIMEDSKLFRESIPNNLFGKEVWKKLIPGMPMTAMIRNLRNMTKAGALVPLSNEVDIVCKALRDEEQLHKSRIHPLTILSALIAYDDSFVNRYGSRSNTGAIPAISDALEDAFYLSFKNIEPTNKKILLAVDVSGSMTYEMQNGIPGMTCNMAAAAMAMVFARTEQRYHIMGFSHQLVDLKITAKDTLKDAMRKSQMDFGGTDCSIPIEWAINNKVDVDCFIVISDMETWAGSSHTFQKMKQYRNLMNKPNSKIVSIGMVSNPYSLSDPQDDNSLDVVGFDSATPQIVSEFIRGEI